MECDEKKYQEVWRAAFAEKLKKHMRRNGYDQRSLAIKLGVTEVTISRYINCHRTPDASLISKLSYIFKCSNDDLLP